MPQRSISSRTFARLSPSVLWIENGCPMIWPTVWRGFSDEYGSWKMICISRRTRPHLARAQARDVAALEADRARGRLEQLEHQPRRRRLAAARLAHDAERLAPAHAQRDVLDGVHLARVARVKTPGRHGEVLGQVLDLDQRDRRASSRADPQPDGFALGPEPALARRTSRWHASAWPPSIVTSGGRMLVARLEAVRAARVERAAGRQAG